MKATNKSVSLTLEIHPAAKDCPPPHFLSEKKNVSKYVSHFIKICYSTYLKTIQMLHMSKSLLADCPASQKPIKDAREWRMASGEDPHFSVFSHFPF